MRINHQKGCMLAKLLYTTFRSEGIHGQSAMPEDLLPEGVARGSREHLLFITLTVAIDYQRDAVDQLPANVSNLLKNSFPINCHLESPRAMVSRACR